MPDLMAGMNQARMSETRVQGRGRRWLMGGGGMCG